MFQRKTVFVVGAGASKELDLPTGPELADRIANLLYFEFDFHEPSKGDRKFYHAMRHHIKGHDELNDHLAAARQISDAVRLTNSIDNYIDIHRHDRRIATLGKAATAYTILKSEADSLLRQDPNARSFKFDLRALSDTWLLHFSRALTNNVALEDIDSIFENVAIVSFNYDRCIEHFLALWLTKVYSIDDARARQLVKSLNVVRPYGTIAGLDAVQYGASSPLTSIFSHSENIRTYTEQIQDEAVSNGIQSTMTSAETVVFLGTAFHPQNMRILRSALPWRVERILASAIGFSDSDVEDIAAELRKLSYPRQNRQEVKITVDNKCKCGGIFTTYSRVFRPAA